MRPCCVASHLSAECVCHPTRDSYAKSRAHCFTIECSVVDLVCVRGPLHSLRSPPSGVQTESDDTKAQMLLEINKLRAEVARLTKAGEPESGSTSSSRKGGASSSKTRAEIPSQAAGLNLKEILIKVLRGEEAGIMPGGAAAPTTTVRVSEDDAKKLHTVL